MILGDDIKEKPTAHTHMHTHTLGQREREGESTDNRKFTEAKHQNRSQSTPKIYINRFLL